MNINSPPQFKFPSGPLKFKFEKDTVCETCKKFTYKNGETYPGNLTQTSLSAEKKDSNLYMFTLNHKLNGSICSSDQFYGNDEDMESDMQIYDNKNPEQETAAIISTSSGTGNTQ